MTQKRLFGDSDERLRSIKDIVLSVAARTPLEIGEERWRSVVMWKSLMCFPDVVCLLETISDLRKWGGNDWVELTERAIEDKAATADLPSFESLTRALREVQQPGWNIPSEKLARSL